LFKCFFLFLREYFLDSSLLFSYSSLIFLGDNEFSLGFNISLNFDLFGLFLFLMDFSCELVISNCTFFMFILDSTLSFISMFSVHLSCQRPHLRLSLKYPIILFEWKWLRCVSFSTCYSNSRQLGFGRGTRIYQ